jgi:hypothetical protein
LENGKKSTDVTRHIKLYRFLFPRTGFLKWWDLAVDYVESELSKIKAVLGKEAFFSVAVRLLFLVKIIGGAEDTKG